MELLREFGVNNADINKLVENNITLDVLKLMDDDDFKRYNIDISIGSKILIDKFLKIQFKQDSNEQSFNFDDIPIVTIGDSPSDLKRQRVFVSEEVLPSAKKCCTNTEIILQNADPLVQQSLYLCDYSLNKETIEELLLENLEGQAVLAKFQNHLRLEDKDRSTMVSILINRCRVADISKPLDFCKKLSDLIVEIFPTESRDIYYIEPLSDGNKTKNAKGKVPDKWRNIMYHLRSAGVLKKKSVRRTERNQKSSGEQSALLHIKQEKEIHFVDNVQSLQTNRNWDEVKEHWEITREYRQKRLKELSKDAFLTEWPVLKSDLASRLIRLDFEKLHPGKESRTKNDWCQLFDDLYTLKKKSIVKPEGKKLCEIYDSLSIQLNIDLDALRLFLLPFLLPWKTKVKTLETQNGIIIQVKSQELLVSEIEKRQKLFKEQNCPTQPFIVVVTPDLMTIKSIYVSLSDQLWSLSSIINALDFTFQLHFVLDIAFPPECYHVWLFLQKMLYDIHLPKVDEKIPIITRVISDLSILNASRESKIAIKMEI